jgi:DNA-binding transcriptional LysR family regulator
MNLLDGMRYLVALEQQRHFGRAAQACGITQPALSNALRALEKELGVAIVRRGRSFEGLTPEGERVLATAHRLLRESELLRSDLHSDAGRPQGSVAIGAVPTAVPIAARFAAKLRARYPGILPIVRSLSSAEIEAGIENLALDLALGYTDRIAPRNTRLRALPQYVEHYFVLRRAALPAAGEPATALRFGPAISWREAAGLAHCMLTPEMHNRAVVDAAFRAAGVAVQPAIESNSVMSLVLSVLDGDVCAVLPGALVAAARGYGGLEALPLRDPEVHTPIGFMVATAAPPTRALEAALTLAQDGAWLRHAAAHSGMLVAA